MFHTLYTHPLCSKCPLYSCITSTYAANVLSCIPAPYVENVVYYLYVHP